MANTTQRVHSTAIISKEAEIAADVTIGPQVIIEGYVRIGSGCILYPRAQLCGPLTLGKGNLVFTGAILGERPQHMAYKDEPTSLEIGDDNVFREYVTVHRATAHSWTTRIGKHNLFMAGSHVAHDSQIGNGCIVAKGALIAGHCVLENNVHLEANSAVHQFGRIGQLAHLGLVSVMTKDLPPFIRASGFNTVTGVNIAGMRQAGHAQDEISAVQRAFHILYQESNVLEVAIEKIDREFPDVSVINALLQFIRQSDRGALFGTKHFRPDANHATEELGLLKCGENLLGQTRPRIAIVDPVWAQ
jgi:UDP-N-acetylglucosamine acyltransferase